MDCVHSPERVMRKACLYGFLMAGLVGHGLISAQSVTSVSGETCERGQRWLTWNRVHFLSSGLALPPPPRVDQRAVTFCIDGVVVEAAVWGSKSWGTCVRSI